MVARIPYFDTVGHRTRWVNGVAVLLLATVVPFPCQAAETPEVLVELDREQVYVGEPVHYRVLLNHCGMQAEPDMSALTEAFEVKFDNRSEIRTTRLLDDGRKRQRLVRVGPLFEYQLIPRGAGTVQVPGPSVEVGGQTLVGRTLTLNVQDLEKQDLVYLAVTSDVESVYPMQPIRLQLTLAVKGLPDPAANMDPLELKRTLPSLTIPWADDEQLDEALQPKEPVNRWLQPYVDDASYGVAINDYQQAGLGFGFFSSGDRRIAFRSSPKRVLREDRRGRLVEYWEYVFARTLIPQRSGRFPLGTVRLKGQFAARINTRGNIELESVYAMARALDLIVKEPPTVGRPDSFTGAIGSFTCGAELTPAEANVGDPMTLTLWLRGEGTLDQAQPPDLAADKTLGEQFKCYKPTEKTEEDRRQFTYSIRPKTAMAKEFPAIPILSYFDVRQEKYVTIRTEPIPIAISATTSLASADISMAHRATNEIGTSDAGIFANVTDLSQLRNDGVHPNRWFFSLGGLACLFVVMAVVVQRLQRDRHDTAWQRRKASLGRARRRLDTVAEGTARDMADGISGALIGLVADVCDLPEEGLTSADAAKALADCGVASELVGRLREVLETCDAMRYASVGTESDALRAQAETLFGQLAGEIRIRKRIA